MMSKTYPTKVSGLYRLEDKPNSKCRKWKIVVTCAPDAKTGKRSQRTKNVTGTYNEALEEKSLFAKAVEAEGPREYANMPFEDYAKQWIKGRKDSRDFAVRTICKYEQHMGRLYPLMGTAKLSSVSPRMIERALEALRRGESPSGKPLSGTTLRCTYQTLSAMLSDAVRLGDIAENPCGRVRAPKSDTKEKPVKGAEDVRAAFKSLNPYRANECAVLLCAMAGLRRSEALALTWGDFDFDKKLMTVSKGMEENGKPKKTKSERVRVLAMPDAICDILRKRKLGFEVQVGRKPKPEDLVHAQPDGSPVLPHSLSTWWRRHREGFGFEGKTIHGMRHAYVTALALSGVPAKVTQMLAGHASITTTMNIYAHTGVDGGSAGAQAVDDIVAG